MLDAILLATRKRDLTWSHPSPSRYEATGAIGVVIEEICPLIAGTPETAGVQAFQIKVNRVIFTFWSGTSGCERIREILAAGFEDFSEHNRGISAQVDEAINRLAKRKQNGVVRSRNRGKGKKVIWRLPRKVGKKGIWCAP